MPPCRRFWIERTKKASKDLDLGASLLWLMSFPTRPMVIQVSAANQEQAAILKTRIDAILYYNEWLKDFVYSVQNRVTSKRSGLEAELVKLVVEPTGSAGAKQGATPDVLVLNELVHVDKWDVMDAHMNNADGVPQGVVIISTNAGVKGTKAEVWRNVALQNKSRWKTFIFKGTAPWISEEDKQDAKKRDPLGKEYGRLWLGDWASGKGGAVDEASLNECFRLDGPLMEPEPGWFYVAGLDLGISHDHSGVAIVGANRSEQRVRVAYVKGWAPSIPNDRGVFEVDCEAVEEACFRLGKQFKICWFGYDPAAGGSFMAQNLRRRGLPMKEMTFASPANLSKMARSFVTMVKAGKLECYEDAEGRLRRDFGKFDIQYTVARGYRLVAVSDEYGHADVGTALVICLPMCVELLKGGIGMMSPGDQLVYDNEPLSKEEVEEMPDYLRELYEMEEGEVEEQERLRKWVERTKRREESSF